MLPKLEIPKLKFHGYTLEHLPPKWVRQYYFIIGREKEHKALLHGIHVGWDVLKKNLIPCPRKNRILFFGLFFLLWKFLLSLIYHFLYSISGDF
jgi:hypothetical protein